MRSQTKRTYSAAVLRSLLGLLVFSSGAASCLPVLHAAGPAGSAVAPASLSVGERFAATGATWADHSYLLTLAEYEALEAALASGRVVGRPAIVPRSTWLQPSNSQERRPNLPDSPSEGDNPAYKGTQALVYHDTVNSAKTDLGSPEAEQRYMRQIARFQTDPRGSYQFDDVSHHFYIGPSGTIFAGRVQDGDRLITATHTKGFNTMALGVSLMGYFVPGRDSFQPQGPQAHALYQLALYKFLSDHAYSLEKSAAPDAQGKYRVTLKLPKLFARHELNQQTSASSSPGSNIQPQVVRDQFEDYVAERVQRAIAGAQQYQPLSGNLPPARQG